MAVPEPSVLLPGISMAGFGFRRRLASAVQIEMVAHPSLTMIIDFSVEGGIAHGSAGPTQYGSFVAGLLPGSLLAGGLDGECLQLRLSPVMARAVLGVSAELTGRMIGLEQILGQTARTLENAMRAARSWDERFRIVADFVVDRIDNQPTIEPEVDLAWQRILAARGTIRVEELAAEVGRTRQWLWTRFRTQLGITPKRAGQLARFDHAAHLLAAGRAAADVAVESGYVDQSHLHREVRTITGSTPRAVAVAPWLAIDDVAWPDHPGVAPRAIL